MPMLAHPIQQQQHGLRVRSSSSIFLIALGLFLGVVVLSASPAQASHLTFEVAPKSSMCFYEDLVAGAPFQMSFEVLRGGLLDIRYQLFDPNRNVVRDYLAFFNRPEEEANEAEGKISITAAASGAYRFCFDNTMSRWTSKVVTFEVTTKRSNKGEAAKLEHLGPMVDSVIKISDELDAIERAQKASRKREKNHFLHVQAVNSRIQWMVMFSTFLLIGLSLFSLMHIQKWFNVDRSSDV